MTYLITSKILEVGKHNGHSEGQLEVSIDPSSPILTNDDLPHSEELTVIYKGDLL